MKVFTVVSPDKLTLSMFSDFLTQNSLIGILIIDISSLFSIDKQNEVLTSAISFIKEKGSEATLDILVRYRTKAKNNILVNTNLSDSSDYIIKFDIFSVTPQILKGSEDMALTTLIQSWSSNIERLNKF